MHLCRPNIKICLLKQTEIAWSRICINYCKNQLALTIKVNPTYKLANNFLPAAWQSWEVWRLQSVWIISSTCLHSLCDTAAVQEWTSPTPAADTWKHEQGRKQVGWISDDVACCVSASTCKHTWWYCTSLSSMETTTSFCVSSSLPASALFEPLKTNRSWTIGCKAGMAVDEAEKCKCNHQQENLWKLKEELKII